MSYWAVAAVSGFAGALIGGYATPIVRKRLNARRAKDPPASDETIRERAKAATLVTSVLTLLVGADPLDIRGSSNYVQIADYGLIAGWLVVIFLFLWAQTAKVAEEYRLRRAWHATVIAVVLTASLLVAKPLGLTSDEDTVLLAVKDQELATITSLCQRPSQALHLYGRVRTGSLGDAFIVLRLDQHANSICNEIKVPRDQITAFIEHPCDQEHGVILRSAGFCPRKPKAESS